MLLLVDLGHADGGERDGRRGDLSKAEAARHGQGYGLWSEDLVTRFWTIARMREMLPNAPKTPKETIENQNPPHFGGFGPDHAQMTRERPVPPTAVGRVEATASPRLRAPALSRWHATAQHNRVRRWVIFDEPQVPK